MRLLRIAVLLPILLFSVSCHDIQDWADDPEGNFDALWTILDEHYCFFEEKGVNWDAVYAKYRPQIVPEMTQRQLFAVCAAMLDELRDGHTNLSSAFNTSYYTKWWSDYPQDYNERLVEQYYFNFRLNHVGAAPYGILPENIGYFRYPSFSVALGEGNVDHILAHMIVCNGIIIDIRDNGGGDMTNVEALAARFIRERTLAGYISHKTGPGHGDFSKPYAYYYEPAGGGHLLWRKPVVVLTNRSTFSAANNFVSIMKYVPDVYIVGATTGGGSGMPFSSEIPCGWGVRFSACSILDCMGNTTEFGISPSEGCAVGLDPLAALDGRDTMLDFAVSILAGGK